MQDCPIGCRRRRTGSQSPRPRASTTTTRSRTTSWTSRAARRARRRRAERRGRRGRGRRAAASAASCSRRGPAARRTRGSPSTVVRRARAATSRSSASASATRRSRVAYGGRVVRARRARSTGRATRVPPPGGGPARGPARRASRRALPLARRRSPAPRPRARRHRVVRGGRGHGARHRGTPSRACSSTPSRTSRRAGPRILAAFLAPRGPAAATPRAARWSAEGADPRCRPPRAPTRSSTVWRPRGASGAATLCVGIDPRLDAAPGRRSARPPAATPARRCCASASRSSTSSAPYAACVKVQIAFFEAHGLAGLRAYAAILAEARAPRAPRDRRREARRHRHDGRGLRRRPPRRPAATSRPTRSRANPYMGRDALEPFVTRARRRREGRLRARAHEQPGRGRPPGASRSARAGSTSARPTSSAGSTRRGPRRPRRRRRRRHRARGGGGAPRAAARRRRSSCPGYGAQGATARDVAVVPTAPTAAAPS